MIENKNPSKKTNKINFLLVLISFLFALIITEIILKNYYKKYTEKYWTKRYNVYK